MQNKNLKGITSIIAGVLFLIWFVFRVMNFVTLVSKHSSYLKVWTVIQIIIPIIAVLLAALMLVLRFNERFAHKADITLTVAFGVLSIFEFIGLIESIRYLFMMIEYVDSQYGEFTFVYVCVLGFMSDLLYFIATLYMTAVAFMSFGNISNILRKLWFIPALLILLSMPLGRFSGVLVIGYERYLFYTGVFTLSTVRILWCIGFAAAGFSLSGDDATRVSGRRLS